MEKSDHDLLIEIHANQTHYIKLMSDHFKEDDENFEGLRKDIKGLEKWRWQVVGGTVVLVFLIEFVARVWAKQ